MRIAGSEAPTSTTPVDAPTSLRVGFVWSAVAAVFYNGTQFLMIVILTREGNSEIVGQFILASTVCAPFQVVSNQLRSILSTDAANEFALSSYLLLATGGAVIILVGSLLIGFVCRYGLETLYIITLVGLCKGVENISEVLHGAMQKRERMDLFAFSVILRSLLSIMIFSGIFYATGSLMKALLGMAIAWTLVLFAFDLTIGTRLAALDPQTAGAGFRPGVIFKLSKRTTPLSLTALLVSLNTSAPRFFLERFGGLSALGYFGPLSYVLSLADTLSSSLGRSVAPRLARYWISNAGEFAQLLRTLIAMVAAASLLGILGAYFFGRGILAFVYGHEYAIYFQVFVALSVAASFSASAQFLSHCLTSIRELRSQAILSALTLLMTLGVIGPLFSRYGLLGVATSVCLGLGFRLAGSAFITRNRVSSRLREGS